MRIPAALLLLLLLLFPKVRAAAGEGTVTRGNFVVLLWESAGAVPYDAATTFTDVSRDHACAQALGWAEFVPAFLPEIHRFPGHLPALGKYQIDRQPCQKDSLYKAVLF